MAITTMVLGQSGTGKTTSIRNFTSDEVTLIKVINKPLPFKLNGNEGQNVLCTDNYNDIKKAVRQAKTDVIIIDDAQYLMSNEFMNRAMERGYDKFTEIAVHFWELIQLCNNKDDKTRVYFLMHNEIDQYGNEKVKTIGKLLDEKITLEGLVTIVLKTVVDKQGYHFATQNNGQDTVKTPIDMFKEELIDNDLKHVDKVIQEYYGLCSNKHSCIPL